MRNGLHSQALAERVAGGDAATYEACRDQVLAVLARRFCWLDPTDREAAFHEAYLVLLEKERGGDVDPGSLRPLQLRAYLVRTAINKALDEGKRAERRRTRPFGDAPPATPDSAPAPHERAVADQEGAQLRAIVAGLPERQRKIVALRFFLDRTPAEAQRHLGITPRTYRRELERALRTLAKVLERLRDGRISEPAVAWRAAATPQAPAPATVLSAR